MDDTPVVQGFMSSLEEKMENIPGLTTIIKYLVLIPALKEYLPENRHAFASSIAKKLLSDVSIQNKIDNVLSDLIYEDSIKT